MLNLYLLADFFKLIILLEITSPGYVQYIVLPESEKLLHMLLKTMLIY